MRFLILLSIFLAACTKSTPPKARTLAEEGQALYIRNCIACHNVDIHKDGSIGPAIAGSSLELLERRVLHGDYPPGYKPKRNTRQMVALPFLKDQIPGLHAYLNTP